MKIMQGEGVNPNEISAAFDARAVFTLKGPGLSVELMLQGLGVTQSGGCGFLELDFDHLQRTSAIWNGPEDGLPPVGWMVDLKIGKSWQPAEVLAHFKGELVLGWVCTPEGEPVVELRELSEIREHRTAEQLAAEEREQAIDKMLTDAQTTPNMLTTNAVYFGALYDAGYRKVEQS